MIKRILSCNEEPVWSDLAAITNDDGYSTYILRRARSVVKTLHYVKATVESHFTFPKRTLPPLSNLSPLYLNSSSRTARVGSTFPQIAAEHRQRKEIDRPSSLIYSAALR